MPLDRLVLILVAVAAAAGLTVWAGAMLISAAHLPQPVMATLILPLALIAFVAARILSGRLGRGKDNHQDHIDN